MRSEALRVVDLTNDKWIVMVCRAETLGCKAEIHQTAIPFTIERCPQMARFVAFGRRLCSSPPSLWDLKYQSTIST